VNQSVPPGPAEKSASAPKRAFKLGLVGCGLITRNSHLPAALASRQIEVVALVDPMRERARQLARDYGIDVRIADDMGDVLGDVDGVLIATPNDSHRSLAVRAFERGVHALIEKPIATTSLEAREMVEAARTRGCVLAVGYVTRFRPNTRLLKELLDTRAFGRVEAFAHQFGTPGGWAPLSGYNLRARSAGGGVLMVTATHFLDRMLFFWGRPRVIDYRDDSAGGPEANCEAQLRFDSEDGSFDGWIRYSKTTRLPGGLVIRTEQGTLVVQDFDDSDIVFRPNGARGVEHVIRPRPPKPVQDTFQLQLEDFVVACRDGRAPAVDGESGFESMKLIEELYARRRPLEPAAQQTDTADSEVRQAA
jgi:predicted dehydrogenase